MHLTVASHFCSGELAAVKYSFTGEKASCGMEEYNGPQSVNGEIHTNCCKDKIAAYTVDGNYFPSFHIIKNVSKEFAPLFVLSDFAPSKDNFSRPYRSMVGPPVSAHYTSVDQSFICVFII
jgi:hypothetical protein